MAFDPAQSRTGSTDDVTPMQIANHSLLTAKEKLDRLHDLKAAAGSTMQGQGDLGFSPEEVDDAINQVRLHAQQGEQLKTVIWGDN